jgi:hypothetical protein
VNNEEFEKTETVVATLRQQEPVAWMCEANVFHAAQWKPALAFEKQDAECFRNWQPLYAEPQSCTKVGKNCGVLHTESVEQPDLARVGEVGVWGDKREWVGLTDEERFLNDARSEEEIEYAKAIEAKLKEKNT